MAVECCWCGEGERIEGRTMCARCGAVLKMAPKVRPERYRELCEAISREIRPGWFARVRAEVSDG